MRIKKTYSSRLHYHFARTVNGKFISIRHAEFISASHLNQKEILKQVQDDEDEN